MGATPVCDLYVPYASRPAAAPAALPPHGCSEAALDSLGADVAVFVGDFGEEDVQVCVRLPSAGCHLQAFDCHRTSGWHRDHRRKPAWAWPPGC